MTVCLSRLARYRRGARWHDDRGVRITVHDGAIDAVLVVGAIPRERGHRPAHLVEQEADLAGVIDVVRRQLGRDDLACLGIHPDMQFPPGAACLGAVLMGLAVPLMPEATDDPALHLMVDGRRCDALSGTHGCYTFLLAGNASEVRLVSRHAERPETAPWVADRRRLGVLLRAITIRRGCAVLPVPLDHPLLADGWWAPEWHAATTLRRWTEGDAVVPLMDAGPGPLLLAVELAATVPYPLSSAARKTAARRVISMAI